MTNECFSSHRDTYVYVAVHADKALNNIFGGKIYYYGRLIKELGIFKNSDNPTYKNTSFGKS